MSTLALISALAALTLEAPAQAADTPAAIEQQVRTGLRHLFDDFAGILTFDHVTWSADKPDDAGHGTNHWTITVDANGELRAQVTWSSGMTHHCGRAGTRQWLVTGEDLLILEPGVEVTTDGPDLRLTAMQSYIRTAESHLSILLGKPNVRGSADVLTVQPDPARPSVTARFVDAVRKFTFERAPDRLVLASVTGSDGQCTQRWDFSEQRPIAGRWFATQVNFKQDSQAEPLRALRSRYTHIAITPAADPDAPAFRRLLQIPQADDPGLGPVVMVTTFSPEGVSHVIPAEAAGGVAEGVRD